MIADSYSISLPIFRAKSSLESDILLMEGEIEGACFSIGENFLLTAGHVVKNILQSSGDPYVSLRSPETEELKIIKVANLEALDNDLGIIELESITRKLKSRITAFNWMEGYLTALDNISCYGYPYGTLVVKNRTSILQRAFKGYIVSAPWELKPIGYDSDPFQAYELSFAVPRGLSGALLLHEVVDKGLIVVGVIIGNSDQKMLVSESEEREEINREVTRIERYETLSLGIAIRGNAIFSSFSSLLGSTIGKHLRQKNLLHKIT